MSTTSTRDKAPSVQQRGKAATQRLQALIGGDDLKLLNAAMAEAAAEEAARNLTFRATIRRLYEDMREQPVTTRSRQPVDYASVKLTPLPGSEGARFDPFAPLDPYALLKIYGPEQLPIALRGYSLTALREATALVRQQHPGTKPNDSRKADSLIEYIVQWLTKRQ